MFPFFIWGVPENVPLIQSIDINSINSYWYIIVVYFPIPYGL